MAVFDSGETIICSITVKDSDAALQDPSTSMNVKVECMKPVYEEVVAATAMTKDSTGTYHYDFQSASKKLGEYMVTYIATDGTRITIESDTFEVK